MFAKLFRYTNLSLQIYLWIIDKSHRQKFYVSLVKNYNPLLSPTPSIICLKAKWEFYDAIES